MRFKDLMLKLYNHYDWTENRSDNSTPMEDTFFMMQQALYESMPLEQKQLVQKWIEEKISK